MDLMSARDILELGRHDVAHLWETVEQEAVRVQAAKVVLVVRLEGLGDCDRSTGLQRRALGKGVLTIVGLASWQWCLRYFATREYIPD